MEALTEASMEVWKEFGRMEVILWKVHLRRNFLSFVSMAEVLC